MSQAGIMSGLRGKTDESGWVYVRHLSRTVIFRSRAQRNCQGRGCHLGITGTWTVTGSLGVCTVRRGAVAAAKGQRNPRGLCCHRSSEKEILRRELTAMRLSKQRGL